MQNDERIPNLVSEFKSDKFWPIFWSKNCRKLAKYPISHFDIFLPKRWSNLIYLNSEAKFWILHRFACFRHPFDMIFSLWFFDLSCIFKNLKLNSRPLKVLEIDFSEHHWADMFHALGRFIFKHQFWQNMKLYSTSEYCVWLPML